MSRPQGAQPIGISKADGKTEVFGVWHNDHMQEVVLAEDFAKEVGALRGLLVELYGAGFNMLGSSGKKRQVYAHVLESKLRDIEKLVPQVTE